MAVTAHGRTESCGVEKKSSGCAGLCGLCWRDIWPDNGTRNYCWCQASSPTVLNPSTIIQCSGCVPWTVVDPQSFFEWLVIWCGYPWSLSRMHLHRSLVTDPWWMYFIIRGNSIPLIVPFLKRSDQRHHKFLWRLLYSPKQPDMTVHIPFHISSALWEFCQFQQQFQCHQYFHAIQTKSQSLHYKEIASQWTFCLRDRDALSRSHDPSAYSASGSQKEQFSMLGCAYSPGSHLKSLTLKSLYHRSFVFGIT